MILPAGPYGDAVGRHYTENWGGEMQVVAFPPSSRSFLPPTFQVLCRPPTSGRDMWTYATSGMSEGMAKPVELHMVSPDSSTEIPELLAAVASFHREIGGIRLGDTVNFGKPWIDQSICDHELVSLPYLDGPGLEILEIGDGEAIRFYWLVPVTNGEVEFKKLNGLDALEARFESAEFNYLDPMRSSLV